VKVINTNVYKYIDEWKKLNCELDLDKRKDTEMQNELNMVKHIEEKLTGLVSNGLVVWDFLKTTQMQRQMDIMNSFYKSKEAVEKIKSAAVSQHGGS
jgi:hypothetical protein